ncbi:MAG TPA: hypothetical protein DDY52_05100 [Candidatus Moranbacteria bacterium]|nr:MAG: RNA polymerase, sigma-24 subunit, ECF subfamily [Candidatus Moranbacteria bacterium GW2011_GWF1_34_10]HBI17488.1 hypothetical protein [Candidatus Moranbacteria bacterium]
MITSEIDALAYIKNGDKQAFGFLYDAYFKKIYNFVFFKTLHKEITEDLVSKIFIKALENIEAYDSRKGNFAAWIFTIANRIIIDQYRAHKNTYDINDFWDLPSGENIFENVSNQQQIKQIKDQLGKLEPLHRDLVIMRVWQNMSYHEISQITGKSESSLKMMFSRTIKNLRASTLLSMIILNNIINNN